MSFCHLVVGISSHFSSENLGGLGCRFVLSFRLFSPRREEKSSRPIQPLIIARARSSSSSSLCTSAAGQRECPLLLLLLLLFAISLSLSRVIIIFLFFSPPLLLPTASGALIDSPLSPDVTRVWAPPGRSHSGANGLGRLQNWLNSRQLSTTAARSVRSSSSSSLIATIYTHGARRVRF